MMKTKAQLLEHIGKLESTLQLYAGQIVELEKALEEQTKATRDTEVVVNQLSEQCKATKKKAKKMRRRSARAVAYSLHHNQHIDLTELIEIMEVAMGDQ